MHSKLLLFRTVLGTASSWDIASEFCRDSEGTFLESREEFRIEKVIKGKQRKSVVLLKCVVDQHMSSVRFMCKRAKTEEEASDAVQKLI